MKKIVSVSRRTDIPALYGNWFYNRIKEGFAGYINPYNFDKYLVSLKKEDVACFIFWSKNYLPFMEILKKIRKSYNFYFHYTINNYPSFLESSLPNVKSLLDNAKKLSIEYSPLYISWRYDPIIISEKTGFDFHLNNFYCLAKQLSGYVKRCFISYVDFYGKVKKQFEILRGQSSINIMDSNLDEKINFAGELFKIADKFDISLYSCCSDFLVSGNIQKGHCIDGELINRLFFENDLFLYKMKPTRKECGCAESTDIGIYDSCINGCIYCYANLNKKRAANNYNKHDSSSAFLGFTKKQSDLWLKKIHDKNKNNDKQFNLF